MGSFWRHLSWAVLRSFLQRSGRSRIFGRRRLFIGSDFLFTRGLYGVFAFCCFYHLLWSDSCFPRIVCVCLFTFDLLRLFLLVFVRRRAGNFRRCHGPGCSIVSWFLFSFMGAIALCRSLCVFWLLIVLRRQLSF